MKKEKTCRGLTKYHFTDSHGDTCSIQKSSAAEQDYIWLGFEETGLKTFTPYEGGWKSIPDDELPKIFKCQSVISNTRMHLTREQVEELLPILKRFVKTGEI